MTNPADTSMGKAVEYLGSQVLRVAEEIDDNVVEAQAADAVALIITGQEYEPVVSDLPAAHPVRKALSELAAALKTLLNR